MYGCMTQKVFRRFDPVCRGRRVFAGTEGVSRLLIFHKQTKTNAFMISQSYVILAFRDVGGGHG